jgi:bifunctional DNA-binding transcriptional regulator/antitoxin component of YhaV-PrlF toxin-antitoxin module
MLPNLPNLIETTSVSKEGQITIPETLRLAHQWEPGQELIAIDVGDGILLKPNISLTNSLAVTTLAQVAGCLKYDGKAKSLDDMEEAIRQGVMKP